MCFALRVGWCGAGVFKLMLFFLVSRLTSE